ncbi:hypothetical protein ABRA89_14540 [Fulvimarina sp. MAC8]
MFGLIEDAPNAFGVKEKARAIAIQVELQVRAAMQTMPQNTTVQMLGDEAELDGAAAVGVVATAYAEYSGAAEAAATR